MIADAVELIDCWKVWFTFYSFGAMVWLTFICYGIVVLITVLFATWVLLDSEFNLLLIVEFTYWVFVTFETEDDSADFFIRIGFKGSTFFKTGAWTGVVIELGPT